jgi:hypothetical protein
MKMILMACSQAAVRISRLQGLSRAGTGQRGVKENGNSSGREEFPKHSMFPWNNARRERLDTQAFQAKSPQKRNRHFAGF